MLPSAALPFKPAPLGVLVIAIASANLGLSLLSPVITLLRGDFSASADQAQLVLGAFMLSVAIGQMISGSLSDQFGRRVVLLVGAIIFGIGGVGVLLSSTIDMLVGFRIVQGLGAAACMTMGRVIVSDSYTGTDAARKLSIVSSAQAVVPLLGFAFGGVIAEFIGWRGSVIIMILGSVLIIALAYVYVAESRRGTPVPFRVTSVLAAYGALLSNPLVTFHALTSGFAVGMFFAMGGSMPYEFFRLGAGPLEFGILFSMTSFGYIAGNGLNGMLVGRVGVARMAMLGSMITVIMPALMLAGHLTELMTPVRLSALCFFFGVCNGLVIANSMICCMRAAGNNSVAGTGLLGTIQMLLGAIGGTLIIALGGAESFTATGVGLLIMSLFGAAASFLTLKMR